MIVQSALMETKVKQTLILNQAPSECLRGAITGTSSWEATSLKIRIPPQRIDEGEESSRADRPSITLLSAFV
jgi:hypothetical protein